MEPKYWRHLLVIIFVFVIPPLFLAIFYGWCEIDAFLGRREVSRFIREHQKLVEQRLHDPKVHAFSLTHDPDQTCALLIRFDVDDKDTYEMLESDLDDIWLMRFPPTWQTNLRSKEELGNNFGYAAWGMNLIGEAIMRVVIAAVAAVVLSGLFLIVSLRRLRHADAFLEHPTEKVRSVDYQLDASRPKP